MRTEIILAESHLYHKLMFPGMLLRKPGNIWFSLAGRNSDLALALDMIEGIEQALTPFGERISRFFHPEFSLPEALMKRYSLREHDTESWFQLLLSEDPKYLSRELMRSAMYPGSELPEFNQEEIPEILNQTFLPQGARWMLWSILRDPHAALTELASLYESLRLFSDALIDPLEMDAYQALEPADQYIRGYDMEWEKLGIDPELLHELREAGEQKWRIMPSLIPWEFRRGYEEHLLIMGYRVPGLLDSLRQMEEEELEARSMFCQSLADPTRYRLCCILARQPMLQKDLAERLGVSQATISHHLQQLRKAGLLSGDKGKQLDAEPIRRFLRGMAADLRVG